MRKKIMTISHERSGTSFLINTIGGNFPEDYLPEENVEGQCLRVDLDGAGHNFADPEEMKEFLSNSKFHDTPIGNIFKSHHTFDYFEPVWEYLQEQFYVFYIYRDGRDVMSSYWRHVRKQGFLWGPMTFTVGEFMRAEPVGAACRYHGPRPPGNMVQRWNDHVVSWMKSCFPDVCYVGYEELSEDFDATVDRIGEFLETDIPIIAHRPKVAGVHPGKGVVGGWKDHFDNQACQWGSSFSNDHDFFNEQGKEACQILELHNARTD